MTRRRGASFPGSFAAAVGGKNKNKGKANASGRGGDGTLLVKNRKATHNYEIIDRFEAGLSLQGSEVKSIRDGQVSLAEAFAQFRAGELWLMQAHVAEYPMAHMRNHDPVRPRKLLLHRRELDKLAEATTQGGLTVVPLSLFLKGGRIKLEIALGRGKKAADKRHTIKEREQKREMQRAIRER